MSAGHTEAYRDFSARLFEASATGRVVRAQVELTYACNLRCQHCYTDPFNTPDRVRRQMDTAEVLGVFDQLRDQGVLWLCLTGGEVFMRGDFWALYDGARERGFLVTLFTNATLVTETVADRLASSPPFSIEVSLHGAAGPAFDAVTAVPGSCGRFREGLERLLARGLPVRVKTNLMTLNRHELAAMRAMAGSYGVDLQVSTTLYPRLDGSVPDALRLPPEERVALEEQLAPPEVDGGACPAADPGAGETPTSDRLYRCGCGTNTVHVDPEGQLGACVGQRDPRVSLREHPLPEAIALLFAALREARFRTTVPCRTCPIHHGCENGPGVASLERGDPEAVVPHFCATAHLRAGRPVPSFSRETS